MAVRIQRKRTAGWRLADATSNPLGAVIVDRGSRYGNPFRITNGLVVEHPAGERVWSCGDEAKARRWASDLFEDWLDGHGPAAYPVSHRRLDRTRILAAIADGTLAGRDLACTCPLPEPGLPDHCHGYRLLLRANPHPTTEETRNA